MPEKPKNGNGANHGGNHGANHGSNGHDESKVELLKDAVVMIIDDDELVRLTTHRCLPEYLKDKAVLVSSGKEAIQKFKEGLKPDLILLDVVMRGVSGKDVFEWLKKNMRDLVKRVYFISGGGKTLENIAFLEEVEDRLIMKPFHPFKFRDKIIELLEALKGQA